MFDDVFFLVGDDSVLLCKQYSFAEQFRCD